MPLIDVLGRRVKLHVARLSAAGAELSLRAGEPPQVALPKREVPEGLNEGDLIEVVVYLEGTQDGERAVATTQPTRLVRDEIAFVRVTGAAPFGSFVEWGPPKELLVPLDEQTRPLRVGERVPIALGLDDTGRLVGTMRIRELLRPGGDLPRDAWIEGEAWREEPGLGLFVILARSRLGLLPAREPHRLRPGDAERFRIARVLPDGKIELSLRGLASEELAHDADLLLAALSRPNPPRVSDHTSPDEIRARFGLTKKAFKRAVGSLLRRGAVEFDGEGCVVVKGAKK
jgi:hypothetical protein